MFFQADETSLNRCLDIALFMIKMGEDARHGLAEQLLPHKFAAFRWPVPALHADSFSTGTERMLPCWFGLLVK